MSENYRGYHWTGDPEPPICTAPTAEKRIAELEEELAKSQANKLQAEEKAIRTQWDLDTANAEIIRLASELAEARKDTVRLDWLSDVSSADIQRVRESECAGDFIAFSALRLGRLPGGYSKTLRSAIDAAMGGKDAR